MKRFLIAGASSGIGYSLADALLQQQHQVLSLSRTTPNLPVSQHLSYDVKDSNEPPAIDGPLDGLVYCPGSINLKPFKSLKQTDFQNDLDISLYGAIKLIQQYLPNLQQSPQASIVLFSTVAVQIGMPYHTSVAAAKGAVEGFARALAAELAPKIRVNVIAPSLVKTPLAARLTDNDTKVQAAADRHPLKRIGEANDIASMASFLLSDNASWMTGQVLHVDGGMSSLKL